MKIFGIFLCCLTILPKDLNALPATPNTGDETSTVEPFKLPPLPSCSEYHRAFNTLFSDYSKDSQEGGMIQDDFKIIL